MHPIFIYENFKIKETENSFIVRFLFKIDSYSFEPTLEIAKKYINNISVTNEGIENIIFHIGLIELVSYWKCACCPKIIINAGFINDEQITWLKKLYFYGLGEFFYLNNINPDFETFMLIEVNKNAKHYFKSNFIVNDEYLLPIGGGKDSIVSLKLLEKNKNKISPFILNPRGASLDSAITAGYNESQIIVAKRTIDKQLIALNQQGYLNGHTPFSSLLAFVTLLISALSGKKYIILSNEDSANEPTVANTKINHQYSKSVEFEDDFNLYVNKYITNSIKYFSFLRPLNELTITRLFSNYKEFYKVFKSCNVGSKTNSWCGKCPKCLFVYIMLSAFINEDELVNIFGRNLLDDEDMANDFEKLTGISSVKPFECVGTTLEVNVALSVYFKKLKSENKYIPKLITFWENTLKNKPTEAEISNTLNYFNNNHNIPKELLDCINV